MAKKSAIVFGLIFVIAGVWGLLAEKAVGFLAADTLSSIIHIVVGLALLFVSGRSSAGAMLKTVGVLYVVFAVLGFVQGGTVFSGSFVTDMTSNVFYLVVGIVVAVLGFSAKKGMSASTPQM